MVNCTFGFFFCLTTNTNCNKIIIEYVLMIRGCRNSFSVYPEIAMDNSRRRQTGGCRRAPHNSCPHGSSPPETSNNSPSIRSSLKIVHRYHHHHLSSSASSLSLSYARFLVCLHRLVCYRPDDIQKWGFKWLLKWALLAKKK